MPWAKRGGAKGAGYLSEQTIKQSAKVERI